MITQLKTVPHTSLGNITIKRIEKRIGPYTYLTRYECKTRVTTGYGMTEAKALQNLCDRAAVLIMQRLAK